MQRILKATVYGLASLCALPAVGNAETNLPVNAAKHDPVDADAVNRVVANVLPALVRIEVLSEKGHEGRMVKQIGYGSGAVITPEGHVLTNHHVAGRGSRFRCSLPDHEEIPATLIGTDVLADLAVIQLDLSARRTSKPLHVAKFGDSSRLKVGDVVFALGSPGSLSQSVTQGIVANTEMITPKLMGDGLVLDGERVGELVRWIGHDAVIFQGNSGGPLANDKGEIVGVNEVGVASLGGAIPGNLAKHVADQLIAHGKVERGWIGLEIQSLLRSTPQSGGALVATVFAGGPAAVAGILPGDHLHQVGNITISDCRTAEDIPLFNELVFNQVPGSEVEFKGERNGQPMTWKVGIKNRAATVAFEQGFTNWGMTAREVTPMIAIELKRDDCRGVQVHSLRPGGPAQDAKPPLQPKDVITHLNGLPIATMADFLAFQESLEADQARLKEVLVEFERGESQEKWLTLAAIGPEQKSQRPLMAERGWLGATVQVVAKTLSNAMKLNGQVGVRITHIGTNTPAEKAELKVGDVVSKVDGVPIQVVRPDDVRVFTEMISARSPGTSVVFTIFRDGAEMKVPVILEGSPQDEEGAREYQDAYFEFAARDLTQSVRDSESLPADLHGTRVINVVANGWASLAGLQKNDIILSVDGEMVADAKSLQAVLKKVQEEHRPRTVFFIQRGVRNLFLEIERS